MAKISIFDKKILHNSSDFPMRTSVQRNFRNTTMICKMFVALEIIWTEQELQQSNGRSLPLFYTCPASKFQLDFFEF